MSEHFQVVLEDLREMAGSFRTEGDTYEKIKPKVTPLVADAGGGPINEMLGAVMECLDVLHTKMAESISEHAGKLRDAHDTYQRHDVDAHGLFDKLMPE